MKSLAQGHTAFDEQSWDLSAQEKGTHFFLYKCLYCLTSMEEKKA